MSSKFLFKEPLTGRPDDGPAKLSQTSWSTYEPEVRKLYSSMTVEKLWKHLKERHPEFTPNPRQFSYQLEKWGLKKYKKGNLGNVPKASDVPNAGDTSEVKNVPVNTNARAFATPATSDSAPTVMEPPQQNKRSRGLLSSRSSASDSMILSQPPNKKARNDDSSDKESSPDIGQASGFMRYVEDPISSVPWACSQPSNGSERSNKTSSSRWISADRISQLHRGVGTDLSSFNVKDYQKIELAAQYLEVAGHLEEAFSLYTLIFKINRFRIHSIPYQRILLKDIVNCSRCISTQGHFQIVYNLIRKEAQLLQSDPVFRTWKFLVNMVLVDICLRQFLTDLAESHLRSARSFTSNKLRDALRLLDGLPTDDRSLDLVLYHYLVQAQNSTEDSLSWVRKPHGERFKQALLLRVPGPFEFTGGRMQNPCIRSCLSWCLQMQQGVRARLRLLHEGFWYGGHVDCSWELPTKINEFRGMYRTSYPPDWVAVPPEGRELDHPPQQMLEVLFTTLWNFWVQEVPVLRTPTSISESKASIWKKETMSYMGISPTELLRITCGYTLTAMLAEPAGLPTVVRLEHAQSNLLSSTDKELASCFLDEFSLFRCRGNQSEWSHLLAKVQVKAPIQESDLENSHGVADHQNSCVFHQNEANEKRYSGMASSLGSKSYLEFKRVNKRMQESVLKLKHKPSTMSSRSKAGSGTKSRWSLWSMEDLSDAMSRNSLSAASGRHPTFRED